MDGACIHITRRRWHMCGVLSQDFGRFKSNIRCDLQRAHAPRRRLVCSTSLKLPSSQFARARIAQCLQESKIPGHRAPTRRSASPCSPRAPRCSLASHGPRNAHGNAFISFTCAPRAAGATHCDHESLHNNSQYEPRPSVRGDGLLGWTRLRAAQPRSSTPRSDRDAAGTPPARRPGRRE